MPRFVRVRGADPDLVVAGAVLWLLAIPAFGLIALVVFHPFRGYGDCFEACAPPLTLLEAVGPPALAWLTAATVLAALAVVLRRRPRIGYAAFGLVGIAILAWVALVATRSGQPIAGLLLLRWPGWSGIAFVNAAWRSRAAGHAGATAS